MTTARSVEAGRLRATMAAAEAERKRWARELHDETLQGLGALKLALRSALRSTDEDRERQWSRPRSGSSTPRSRACGRSSATCAPPPSTTLGLEAAFRALSERIAERGGFVVETDLELGDDRLDPEIEIAAYRVVQEALNNVVKHAAATRVTVRVRRRPRGAHGARGGRRRRPRERP